MPHDPAAVPPFVRDLEQLWVALRDLIVTSNERKDQLTWKRQGLTGREYVRCPWECPDNYRAIVKAATELASDLATFAARELAPAHGSLTLSSDDITRPYRDLEERIRRQRDYESWDETAARIAKMWMSFSILRAWKRLTRRYTPAAAAAAAYQDTARTLRDGLNLDRHAPTVTKQGVTFFLYANLSFQRTGYSHGTIDTARSVWEALRVVAALELGPDVAAALQRAPRIIDSWYHRIASRARVDLGGGVCAATQQTKILLTLPRELAEALMRFVAQHTPEALRAA